MFRLAIAQVPADLVTLEERIGWLRGAIDGLDADLVLLPELFACGYNIGSRVRDGSEPVDGPTFDVMADIAETCGVALHYGFVERSEHCLFNSAICVSPKGEVLTHQRKLALPPGFERDYFTAGQGCDLFRYRGVKMATLICYDAEFPETARHVASMGAELVLVPTALGAQWPWVAHSMIPTRAYENGVYLAYANWAGVDNDLAYLGASTIVAPDGVEAARAGPQPDIIIAEIDTQRVATAQTRLPYLTDRASLALERTDPI